MLSLFEAWLDEENCQYYCAEETDFWQVIVGLIMAGYRVQ